MSALQNKVNKPKKKYRRVQGQLIESEGQGSLLAKTQGLDAPPTSPGGAASTGQSPDASKMAGSKAQKDASLEQSAKVGGTLAQEVQSKDPAMQLSTARRTETARTGMSEADERTMQAKEALAGITGVPEQAKNLIASKIDDLGSKYGRQLDEEKMQDLDPVQRAALEKIEAGDVAGGVFEYNQNVPEGERITTDEAMSYFESPEEALDRIFASPELSESLTVTDDLLSKMGVDRLELSKAGVEIPENTSISQFIDLVNTGIDEEYNRIADLESIANDPNISPSQRAEARQELVAMGASGVEEAEREIQEIDDVVAGAGTFTIDGEDYTLEELFSEEGMSELLAEAMENPEGTIADEIKSIKGMENVLGYLDEHQESMKKLTENLDYQTGRLEEIQKHNQSLNEIAPNVDLSDSTMSKIYGDEWGKYTNRKLMKPPFMQGLEAIDDPLLAEDFKDVLENASEEEFDRLVNMGPNDLRKIQAGGGMDVYKKRLDLKQEFDKGNTASVFRELGFDQKPEDIRKGHRLSKAFGFPLEEGSREALVMANNMDDPDYTRKFMRKALDPLSGQPLPNFSDIRFSPIMQAPEGFKGSSEEFINNYVKPLKSAGEDGIITVDEIQSEFGPLNDLDPDILNNLKTIPGVSRDIDKRLAEIEAEKQRRLEERLREERRIEEEMYDEERQYRRDDEWI